MRFGGKGDGAPMKQSQKSNIKQIVESEQELNGYGYMSSVYNVLFLLQAHISKGLHGDVID